MLFKKPTFYLAVAGTAATVAMVSHLNGQSPIKPPPIEPSPRPYAVSIAASGIIEALSENVAIGVPEAGLVTKVHVKVWDSVQEGQPLFTLDNRELQSQLIVNEANATVAEATLRRLQDQLARLKGVNDSRAVSAEEVRTKEHDVAVAQAQVESARAQVAQNKVLLERMTVLAPRAGTILQVNVRPGEYASATPKSPALVLGDVENLHPCCARAQPFEHDWVFQLLPGAPSARADEDIDPWATVESVVGQDFHAARCSDWAWVLRNQQYLKWRGFFAAFLFVHPCC
jgi:multidrug efflux pump subunit AcrA (membrane-fusion protein)